MCRVDVYLCRYQFFLQLKLDILSGRLPCDFDTCVELAAYVVQCSYSIHHTCFFLTHPPSWAGSPNTSLGEYRDLSSQFPNFAVI